MKSSLFNFFFFVSLLLLSAAARANICGTDYQNFNPTSNGLDFVTVQSSETLKPCIINMGLFFNYASNSLTYSQTLNQNYINGQKRNDKILGADLSLGMGITDRWDFGIAMPFVLSHSVGDDYYVSSFEENGATEIKVNTKYRLLGDDTGGLAAIVSINKNLIQDNPFSGKNEGLTINYELAIDTTIADKWAAAFNFGYRDRSPGTPIAGVPFVPMEDQWIYSAAGSYLISSLDTKVIFEIYGSRTAKSVDQDTDRSLSALEGLIGAKYDYSQNIALHMGGSRKIDSSVGGAEWRVYAGVNWVLGPVCKSKEEEKPVAIVEPMAKPNEPVLIKLDSQILFKTDSVDIDEVQILNLDIYFTDILNQPFERMVIEGHTDSIGPEAYNLDLSRKRAETVRNSLIKKFKLPPEKVEFIGLGSSQPIANNGNYQGRRQNRRVQLKIWRTQK